MRPRFLQIPDDLLDDLLSALRRHNGLDAGRLLAAWSSAEREWTDETDAWDWLDLAPTRYLDDELSAWMECETALHVADRRFEHALCIIERYRRPLTAADMHARLHPTGVSQ